MFDQLSSRLTRAFRKIRGRGRLNKSNIADTLREVRQALLEADVALPVVKEFLVRVGERAVGKEVQSSLTPGQAMVKTVHEELVELMGGGTAELNLRVAPPAVMLVVGLQGAGKTTTIAKLGRHLRVQHKKSVLVCSCDVYRPAAIEQLKVLAQDHDLLWRQDMQLDSPKEIVEQAAQEAKRCGADVLLVDTAGRLHVDEEMMREVRMLHEVARPAETLFVIDSMMGQDAVHAAKAFSEAVPLTGALLTKTDGDARGGAALTVRSVTGVPIKFMGTGEKVEELSAFHPERVASRILGMGDVLSLVEEVEQKTSRQDAEKVAKKIQQGKGFSLEDMRAQLAQVQDMGGIGNILDKLPGVGGLNAAASAQMMDGKQTVRMIAMIDSMTPQERRRPEVINGSRKRRIAGGSGSQVQDVNRLLKQHKQTSKMMKRFAGKGGMQKMMRMLQGAGKGMPPR